MVPPVYLLIIISAVSVDYSILRLMEYLVEEFMFF